MCASGPCVEPDEALALSLAGGPSVPRLVPLLERFGSFREIIAQRPEALLLERGIGPESVRRIVQAGRVDVEAERERMRRAGVVPLVWGHSGYPAAFLRGMPSPPLVLYAKGDTEALDRDGVAVVGTRRPTQHGARLARRLGGDLAGMELVVVSGLATGIDGEAHRGCLDGRGVTVAVLAHGLQSVQPPGHRELARAILERGGALVSEYPLGVTARRHTFVPRNRLIAGLAEATVVVEGGARSGARHSAEFAADYDRVVLAVPGRPSDPQSALPNMLLRERRAEVCRDAADVLASLRPDQVPAVRRAIDERATILAHQAERALRSLGEEARKLLNAMGTEPVHVDTLCARTGFQTPAVLTMLLRMEMENLVEELPGMRWLPNYRPHGRPL